MQHDQAILDPDPVSRRGDKAVNLLELEPSDAIGALPAATPVSFDRQAVGAKYDAAGSALLASSSGLAWSDALGVELRRHLQLQCNHFVQPANEVVLTVRGATQIRRRSTGDREQRFVARPGTACLCPRDVDVQYLQLGKAPLHMLHLYLPHDLFGLASVAAGSRLPDQLIYTGGIHDPLIEHVGHAIVRELNAPGWASSTLVESLSISLTAHLLQRYGRTPDHTRRRLQGGGSRGSGLDARRLSRVLEYIDQYLDADLSLAAMAEVACLSVFHFARAFKQSMGVSPHQYVSSRRIDRAKQMLARSSAMVEDVAIALRFSSSANFSRAFKRAVGVTPRDYARSAACDAA